MITSRVFYLVTCISLVSLILTPLKTSCNQLKYKESFFQETYKYVAIDPRYSEVYRNTNSLRKGLKYVLLWTAHDYSPFYYFGMGQRGFIKNNCSVINCYVTCDRNFLDGDVTRFDAIIFNGNNIKTPTDLPNHRSLHQKYIYANMESNVNNPICNKTFDGFFNWTLTYKLNSDIPFPYILIRNDKGEIIGPKTKMQWSDLAKVDDELMKKFANKSKAAAWFVSNCKVRNRRRHLVKKLRKALDAYGYSVDVYGSCGKLECPKNQSEMCNALLDRDYFFYMSLENSFAEDYVTEKLLTALQHNVVPITYGGADYSRFLPPGSYLDARKMTIPELAATMDRLMKSPKSYSQYFRWQSRYSYSNPSAVENVCALCAALNNEEMTNKVTEYKTFRKWWNSDFKKRCSRM